MSKHQPNAADEEKLLVSLLYQAQAIAVRLDIDLVEKCDSLFSRSLFWEPREKPVIREINPPNHSSNHNISNGEKTVLDIISQSEAPISPLEIFGIMEANKGTITSYSQSTVQAAVRSLEKCGLIARGQFGKKVVYSAK